MNVLVRSSKVCVKSAWSGHLWKVRRSLNRLGLFKVRMTGTVGFR